MQETKPEGRYNSIEEEHEFAELVPGEFDRFGDIIAPFEDGEINVFGAIPGERVIARIVRYRRKRKHYVSGIVTEVLEASKHRVSPPCPFYGPCSGCQWQHIDYSYQLLLKQKSVERQIERYKSLNGVSVSPTLQSPNEFGYRNHGRFTVRHGSLGFVNRITRRWVKVEQCMLMDSGVNRILDALQENCAETPQLSVRHGTNTGDFLIQPTMKNPAITLPTGQTHYREKVLDREFLVASPSFFQVNTAQAERMSELVRERLKLTGNETLVDAYAGVGTFAALFAPYAKQVIAIEESYSAVRDAAVNIEGLDNLKYLEGKTEHILVGMEEAPDAVILDPPRAGCHIDTLNALVRTGPKRIVYVSCDPETLARDLDILVKGGFAVESVEPVDMFPQTYHVECVATLVRPGE
jgi:23S rRNA (uracil1939-C5)-methyltransferase